MWGVIGDRSVIHLNFPVADDHLDSDHLLATELSLCRCFLSGPYILSAHDMILLEKMPCTILLFWAPLCRPCLRLHGNDTWGSRVRVLYTSSRGAVGWGQVSIPFFHTDCLSSIYEGTIVFWKYLEAGSEPISECDLWLWRYPAGTFCTLIFYARLSSLVQICNGLPLIFAVLLVSLHRRATVYILKAWLQRLNLIHYQQLPTDDTGSVLSAWRFHSRADVFAFLCLSQLNRPRLVLACVPVCRVSMAIWLLVP